MQAKQHQVSASKAFRDKRQRQKKVQLPLFLIKIIFKLLSKTKPTEYENSDTTNRKILYL